MPVPLSVAPLNAFLWAGCFVLVFLISFQLLNNTAKALIAASIFSFFPANLMHSIQLLKDPFYIFGVLLFLFAWVLIWAKDVKQGAVFVGFLLSMAAVGLGFHMVANIRPYLKAVWVGVAFVFCFFSLLRYPRRWWHPTALIAVILFLFITNPTESFNPKKAEIQYRQYRWSYSNWVPDRIENQLFKLSWDRERFCNGCRHSGSSIDIAVRFHSVRDVMKYIPRAMEIGFLAPFPEIWFGQGGKTGKLARLIVGGEMVVLYFLYGGMLIWFMRKGIGLRAALLTCWGMAFVLLISLVVMNLGALHRMRHIYLLPVFVYGAAGWVLLRKKVIAQ